MPDTTDEDEAPERGAIGGRLAWFFGIAAVSGLAFAGAAGILRWLILH
jgi:hypothetical protein